MEMGEAKTILLVTGSFTMNCKEEATHVRDLEPTRGIVACNKIAYQPGHALVTLRCSKIEGVRQLRFTTATLWCLRTGML